MARGVHTQALVWPRAGADLRVSVAMKWVLIAVGVLALALGAAFGVGYFVLQPKLTVEQSIQIDRHRSMVFPLAANLAIFQEWSPWARMDPSQRFEVQGSAGIGQTARFVSANAQIGQGGYKIAAVTPNLALRYAVDGGPIASGALSTQFDFDFVDASGGAQTTWRITRDCGTNWDSVPCRYINLFTASSAATAMGQGLARLKRLAEDLPALDISDVSVAIETRPAQPFVYVESASDKTQEDRVAQAILGASSYVQQFLSVRQSAQLGPRVVVLTRDDERQAEFRVGYVYTGPALTDVVPPVRVGETPSGKAAKFVHVGSPVKMQVSYAQLYAYLRAHRIQPNGLPWEVYVQPAVREDQSDARIEIFIPVK